MRCGKFRGELFLPRFRPLAINELEEIEPDTDAIDADQIRDMFDVIDITIERALFFPRANEDGINADHAAPFADHLDLLVTDVALDVVIVADIGV